MEPLDYWQRGKYHHPRLVLLTRAAPKACGIWADRDASLDPPVLVASEATRIGGSGQ